MKPEELKQYFVQDEKPKYDLGVGVVNIYKLKNGMSYLVMGEYHNKGALSPTVGARVNKNQSVYNVIKDAFARKRLGEINFTDDEIDEKNIYYSVNEKQKLARLTFVQSHEIDLSDDEFKERYIFPMHLEAQHQRTVSELFWKLDETVNPNKKNSKFKFQSDEERMLAAQKALASMKMSHFRVSDKIEAKIATLENKQYIWDEEIQPLEFYEKNGGRKYSELTGFYFMSLKDILEQLKNPKIKDDPEKQTIFIDHTSLPKEKGWKKFFIFEDEVKTISEIICQLAPAEINTPTVLKSPWTLEKISYDQLKWLFASHASQEIKTLDDTSTKMTY